MDSFAQAQYIILSVFVLILGGLALFIYFILRKEHELQHKEEATFNKYKSILESAEQQAIQLMETTTDTSGQILSNAKATSEHVEIDLDRVLQSIADKHIQALHTDTQRFQQDYEQKLQHFQQQFDTIGQDLVEHAKQEMGQTLDQTTKSLMEKSTQSQDAIDSKTQALITQMHDEIAEYKKERITKVDQEIADLVQKTYKEVLGQSLNETAQHKLIMEALEKARKEGVLTV